MHDFIKKKNVFIKKLWDYSFSKWSNLIFFFIVVFFSERIFFLISFLWIRRKMLKNCLSLLHKSLLIQREKKFVEIKISCNNQCIWICYRAWIVQTWSFFCSVFTYGGISVRLIFVFYSHIRIGQSNGFTKSIRRHK